MIAWIIEWCGRHRGVVLAATAVLSLLAFWSMRRIPLDALPDLSDTQVIVFTEWMGRGPTLIEDQITYPITSSFLGAPRVKAVRGLSMFGMSFVYVVFEDGTDMYWARSRTLEYLSTLEGRLPEGVAPRLGPDATGVGWVYEYALVDRTGRHDLADLRTYQDWTLRYALAAVPGVAEVATVGGYEKQYQVTVDPTRLHAYGITLEDVSAAIQRSNLDVGGRVVESAEREYVLRGRGYLGGVTDLESIAVAAGGTGTPIRLRDVATVHVGGEMRRGFAELDGEGEVVAGIVVMRAGENALAVIERVRARIDELRPSFPPGVELVTAYDRAPLIRRSVATLRDAVVEGLVAMAIVTAVFLLHLRSALVAAVFLPVAVLLSFLPMHGFGMSTNIMALAGIILAIGDMTDAAVVLVENAHRRLTAGPAGMDRVRVIIDSAKELGAPIFGSLLILTVAFFPVFALEAQEGRLFHPLAWTKTFAMAIAAILSITLVPALMVFLIRGRVRDDQRNPVTRTLVRGYRPLIAATLRRPWIVLGSALVVVIATVPIFRRLGSEFMPPLDEGTLLYMPVSVPGIAIEEAKRIVAIQDRALRAFPEVESVLGKAGRADTATDPAPLSMIETVVVLAPKDRWRPGMTPERLQEELAAAVETPGFQSAWTMPIKARIDMQTTGIRTPVGIKVFGPDLARIAEIGEEIEAVLRDVPGSRSVYAEREFGGYYLDFVPDREAIARHGLRVRDVLDVVETAIGGMEVDRTFEGRERYSINVRYPRELRSDPVALGRILVPIGPARGTSESTAMGMGGMDGAGAAQSGRVAHVPLGQLGRFESVMGPPMIKSEGGSLVGWVYVDVEDRDIGGYVDAAKRAVAAHVELDPGYRLVWTGQYEFLERIRERLAYVIPLTLVLVFAILYVSLGGAAQALLVMASVPLALVGSVWIMATLDYNTSIASYVGMIALVGMAAETATIMVVYLDQAHAEWNANGRLRSRGDLLQMAAEAATLRVRPIMMTMTTDIVALMPIMIATGPGADVAKRIASPMWGGLVSLMVMTLFVTPALYLLWRGHQMNARDRASSPASGALAARPPEP